MATIKRFEDIEAWQTARALTKLVYEKTNDGSFARDYGLKDQIRRACVSAMPNTAEGFESRTQALFIEFLGRAKGSAGEVRSQAYVALDNGYVSQTEFRELFELADKCSRQISNFMSYLESHPECRTIRETGVEYAVRSND
jgi:four helix bundle protein